jgi:hypothetical protein
MGTAAGRKPRCLWVLACRERSLLKLRPYWGKPDCVGSTLAAVDFQHTSDPRLVSDNGPKIRGTPRKSFTG